MKTKNRNFYWFMAAYYKCCIRVKEGRAGKLTRHTQVELCYEFSKRFEGKDLRLTSIFLGKSETFQKIEMDLRDMYGFDYTK
jgi:hypothetical protein